MFTLALALGRTVSELEDTMTSHEFSEWLEFYTLEPFGPRRDNLHAGQIAALLFNSNRGKNQKPLTVDDFMYKDAKTAQEMEEQEFMARLDAVAKRKS